MQLRFIAMNITYSKFEIVHHIQGIPDNSTWGHFCQLMTQTMQDHIEWERHTMMKCEPDTLLNQTTMRLTIESQCLESENCSHIQCPRQGQGPGSEYINFTHDSPIWKHVNNPNGVLCTNCQHPYQWSHDFDHCYREGGGMAGQGPRAKVKAEAAARKDHQRLTLQHFSIP